VIELVGIAIGSFLIALSGALMPGPLFTVTISESLKRGKWTGPLLIIGHGILELSLLVLILAGLEPIFKINIVVGTISLLGGFILLWMGCTTLIRAQKETLSYQVKGKKFLSFGPVVTGILASLSNPYWFIWWATVGLGYMVASFKYKWAGITAFFLGHIIADFSWYTIISFSVASGKKFISDRIYQIVLLVCGGVLCFFGIMFLYLGWQRVL